MRQLVTRLRASVPDSLLAALAVGACIAGFVGYDQSHWWRMKPDYAFGWLVPLFVGYVVMERWELLSKLSKRGGVRPVGRLGRGVLAGGVGVLMAGSGLLFLFGALYRGGAGVSQPGSFALAAGFSGLLLGLVYFNAPDGSTADGPAPTGLRGLFCDVRLRITVQFLFPALIWMLSAPLVDAVENQLSLALLRKVVAVVHFVFGMLGLPLIQEGNVLILPRGEVGVADACSGIRSLTACLFAGSFLAAVFADRFWKKVLLVGSALLLAFLTNLLRSLFLTGWAYRNGSDSINGTVHDATGYAVLGLTCVCLLGLLPLLNAETWLRWLGPRGGAEPATPDGQPPAAG